MVIQGGVGIELRHPGDWLGGRREESGCRARFQGGWCESLRDNSNLEGGDEESSPEGGIEVLGGHWGIDAQQAAGSVYLEPRRGIWTELGE